MIATELVGKVVFEAILGPAVTSMLTKILTREQQRRRCASLYTMLIRSPVQFRDEVVHLGVSEGCWSEKFAKTFVSAEDLKVYGGEDDVPRIKTRDVSRLVETIISSSIKD